MKGQLLARHGDERDALKTAQGKDWEAAKATIAERKVAQADLRPRSMRPSRPEIGVAGYICHAESGIGKGRA